MRALNLDADVLSLEVENLRRDLNAATMDRERAAECERALRGRLLHAQIIESGVDNGAGAGADAHAADDAHADLAAFQLARQPACAVQALLDKATLARRAAERQEQDLYRYAQQLADVNEELEVERDELLGQLGCVEAEVVERQEQLDVTLCSLALSDERLGDAIYEIAALQAEARAAEMSRRGEASRSAILRLELWASNAKSEGTKRRLKRTEEQLTVAETALAAAEARATLAEAARGAAEARAAALEASGAAAAAAAQAADARAASQSPL